MTYVIYITRRNPRKTKTLPSLLNGETYFKAKIFLFGPKVAVFDMGGHLLTVLKYILVFSEQSSLFLMTNPVLSGSNGVVETTRNTIPLENPGEEW